MRSIEDVEAAINEHGDTVRRICFIHLKNHADVEDVFQEVFLKYAIRSNVFESHAHEKAWLLRVAINQCKDVLKSYFRRNVSSIEDADVEAAVSDESREILDAVLRLPDKYRDVIYLFYYEGYSAVEIAKMLGKRENTIYTWLGRGRDKLKDLLGGEMLD